MYIKLIDKFTILTDELFKNLENMPFQFILSESI